MATAWNCLDVPATAPKKVLTLALISNDNQILLGLKKRGFGEGLWNGFGGKVNPGETIKAAAVREVTEECGLIVNETDMEQFAVICFEFVGDPVILEVHVFKATKYSGQVSESEEMLPKWYPRNRVPHSNMWPDDEIWYPLYLEDMKFQAYFRFEGHQTILSYVIRDYKDPTVILKES